MKSLGNGRSPLIFAWLYRNGHHAKALELLKYIQYIKRGLALEQRGGKNKVFSIDYDRSKSIIIIGEINSEFWQYQTSISNLNPFRWRRGRAFDLHAGDMGSIPGRDERKLLK